MSVTRESVRVVFLRMLVAFGILLTTAPSAHAGAILGFSGAGLTGGFRWDADPFSVDLGGTLYERSLDGGLRYSLEGGSYEAFRDLFSWVLLPSVADFTAAIDAAFAAWASVDPVTGLGTDLSFVADLGTPVVGTLNGGGVDPRGAEIDLFASDDANSWDPGDPSTKAEALITRSTTNLATLTSGTPDYAGASAITGADITFNSDGLYTLDFFRRLLTHEIGHTLGFLDAEGDFSGTSFVDDNYDGTSNATGLATLTNSWALLVNPLDPAASPLSRYMVPWPNPGGTTSPGVDLLMESRGLGAGPGTTNPLSNLVPLTNDDYGSRQFLYPYVAPVAAPEPATLLLTTVAAASFGFRRRLPRLRSRSKSHGVATRA